MSRRAPVCALAGAALLAAAFAPRASAQTVYVAFGDSITFGSFDETAEPGYPPELEDLLNQRGVAAQVVTQVCRARTPSAHSSGSTASSTRAATCCC